MLERPKRTSSSHTKFADATRTPSGRYFLPRRRWAADALRLGRARGQLRSNVDLEVVLDQVQGAICNPLLTGVAPLDVDLAADLVDNLIVGIGRVLGVSSGIDPVAGAV